MKQRLDYIDIAKGIGIILVVLSHTRYSEIMYYTSAFYVYFLLLLRVHIIVNQRHQPERELLASCRQATQALSILQCATTHYLSSCFTSCFRRYRLFPILPLSLRDRTGHCTVHDYRKLSVMVSYLHGCCLFSILPNHLPSQIPVLHRHLILVGHRRLESATHPVTLEYRHRLPNGIAHVRRKPDKETHPCRFRTASPSHCHHLHCHVFHLVTTMQRHQPLCPGIRYVSRSLPVSSPLRLHSRNIYITIT